MQYKLFINNFYFQFSLPLYYMGLQLPSVQKVYQPSCIMRGANMRRMHAVIHYNVGTTAQVRSRSYSQRWARGLDGYDVALTWRRSGVRLSAGPPQFSHEIAISLNVKATIGALGHHYAQVAQLGERCPEEAAVPGSSPGLGT